MTENDTTFQQITDISSADRTKFIRQTYLHVSIAVVGFILLELVLFSTGIAENIAYVLTKSRYTWVFVLAAFAFISFRVVSWCKASVSLQNQYLALFVYILAESIIFVPVLYTASYYAPGTIEVMTFMTLFLLVSLFGIALLTKKNFSFLKSSITIAGMLAIGAVVLGIVFGFSPSIFFSFAMLSLAGLCILYHTTNLVNYHTHQYVAAGLGLFASFMLLFWYVMRIGLILMGED